MPAAYGAEFVDYVIADKVILPFDQQPFFTEKIIHLPDSYWVTDSSREISGDMPSRAEAGLPPEGFVFCCFNNNWKIARPLFEIWMRLLKAVPGSVLWLLEDNKDATARLRSEAAARGVDPERLVFAPRMELKKHLPRHRLADLALDTLPCNAHTTAVDALWTGLPVVTCPGDSFAARVAASLLIAAGLPELVTPSLAQYEARALELALNPGSLQAIRYKLQQNRLTTALFDSDRFRRNIEAAYATMHDMQQRGEPPKSFAVANQDA
jgi:predicted O-linked N-acetylglucosamine transferase (SPINDLY family)